MFLIQKVFNYIYTAIAYLNLVRYIKILRRFNPFMANVPILYPLRVYSHVIAPFFRGYNMRIYPLDYTITSPVQSPQESTINFI